MIGAVRSWLLGLIAVSLVCALADALIPKGAVKRAGRLVCGLTLLAAIEEEAGSEASAHEIVEITQLVREYEIPVIFTEANGSDATAQAIARETGCRVVQLSMVIDGPDGSLEHYLNAVTDNVIAVVNGFAGKEVVQQG